MNEDAIGLAAIVALLAFMGWVAARGLRRHNPNGDKCEHGVRGGEGFDCSRCDGRAYEVQVHTQDGLVDEYRVREGATEPADFRRVP